MPVFEFCCADCGRKFATLVGMTAQADDTRCPHCASPNTSKLVSRFARYRVEDDRIDEVADRLESMSEPDSPAEMRRLVREMGKAMEDDVSGEMEAMLDADLSGDFEPESGA